MGKKSTWIQLDNTLPIFGTVVADYCCIAALLYLACLPTVVNRNAQSDQKDKRSDTKNSKIDLNSYNNKVE